MDKQQFAINVDHLKEIVSNQSQVRTNKLKPYIQLLEEAVAFLYSPAEEQEVITPNTDPEKNPGIDLEIEKLADFINEFYPDEPGSTGENESAVDVAVRLLSPTSGIPKENRYLKRKQTMYDLKIANLEKEVKKWRAMAKGNEVREG